MAPGFVQIISEAVPPPTASGAPSEAPVIEVRLAGAVVRVVSGMDDAGRQFASTCGSSPHSAITAIRCLAARAAVGADTQIIPCGSKDLIHRNFRIR
jgi:hypothetical protein